MQTYADIEKKIRRAIRNEGGTNIGFAEIKLLVEAGFLELLGEAVNKELKSKWQETQAPSSTETTGSTSSRPRAPKTGISVGMKKPLETSALEALVAGA